MSRACGGKLEDGVGVVRGGGGDDADTAASEVLQTVVDEPRSCTDQDFAKKTPDQVRGAAARGSPTAPQMKRRLDEEPLSNKELLRRLLAAAPIGASGVSSGGASESSSGVSGVPPMVEGPEAVSPVPAPGGSPGTNGLGSGSAAAIESVQRGRLQGPGLSCTPGITHLASSPPAA